MTLLLIGLVLWMLVHAFKRVAPDARGGMAPRWGRGRQGASSRSC